MAALLMAGVFLKILAKRAVAGLVAEIGAVYTFFLLAYTVAPAFTFLILELDFATGWVWQTLHTMLPDESKLAVHLWRHVLYIAGFCMGYLWARNVSASNIGPQPSTAWDGSGLLIPLSALLVAISVALILLSAPVVDYIDHYSRYDHLNTFLRATVSLMSRIESGLMLMVLVLSFMNFRRYSMLALSLAIGIFIYKIWNSMGARIESLFVLLMVVCLYQIYVRQITALKILFGLVVFGAVFTAIEFLRAANFNASDTAGLLSSAQIQPASEFGAVFFTGFHLYTERTLGTIPPVEWPMFFHDIVSLVMPNSYTRFNPQYWYAENYFPDYDIPPQTNGPIADSALWGGEFDLAVRALLNGLLFAWLANFFFTRRNDWRAAAVYVFCYSSCLMTLKYSILYHLNPLVKTVIPMVILMMVLKGILSPTRQQVAQR